MRSHLAFFWLIALASFSTVEAQQTVLFTLVWDSADSSKIRLSDISSIDTANNIIVLAENFKLNARSAESRISQVILHLKNKTEDVQLSELLSSNYLKELSVIVKNGNLFFYGENQIVLSGKDWKKILKELELPFK